jgi:hypothetical protein
MMMTGHGPSRRQSPSFALEEHHAGCGSHRWRAEQKIEGVIALKMVEEPAQGALGAKPWIGRNEAFARIGLISLQKFGDRLTCSAAVLERRMDAAGGQRRDHAGGIADSGGNSLSHSIRSITSRTRMPVV